MYEKIIYKKFKKFDKKNWLRKQAESSLGYHKMSIIWKKQSYTQDENTPLKETFAYHVSNVTTSHSHITLS